MGEERAPRSAPDEMEVGGFDINYKWVLNPTNLASLLFELFHSP